MASQNDTSLSIRDEEAGDVEVIDRITTRAFAPMGFSDGTEPGIIKALRSSGDLTFSMVAEIEGEVRGHVAFSPVSIGAVSKGWFGLGPIAVQPEYQGQGIGRGLIEAGLARLKDMGASGCILTGNPALYSRFGFVSDDRVSYGDVATRFIQYVLLEGDPPRGEVKFAPAFDLAPE